VEKFSVRVKSQFKSPMASGMSVPQSSVRLTPTVQALERQIQNLKRAIKVKQSGEEETLTKLTKKWTEVGRDVAWEVWSLVRDRSENGGGSGGWDSGSKSGSVSNWGWGDNNTTSGNSSWGWDGEGKGSGEIGEGEEGGRLPSPRASSPGEEDVKAPDTLGTMLRHLGIAPETLGWNDNLDDFADN
jgi:hypothetical protein